MSQEKPNCRLRLAQLVKMGLGIILVSSLVHLCLLSDSGTRTLPSGKHVTRQLRTNGSNSSWQRTNPGILYYNRVPKSGSTTFTTLLKLLSTINGFEHRSSSQYSSRLLSALEQVCPTKHFANFRPLIFVDRRS